MRRAVLLAICLALAGCDSPAKTVETARKQITEFQTSPNEERQAAIEESLAKLDAQVAELEKNGDDARTELFRKQAARLRADFQAAKISRAFKDAKNAIRGIGDAFKGAGKIIGDTFKTSETNEP